MGCVEGKSIEIKYFIVIKYIVGFDYFFFKVYKIEYLIYKIDLKIGL